jgi:hypothetical protein
MGGTVTAMNVEPEPHGISGTVPTTITSGGQTSFTPTLPSVCTFTTLAGATCATVYQQPKTAIAGRSSVASGSALNGFGLMFFENRQ